MATPNHSQAIPGQSPNGQGPHGQRESLPPEKAAAIALDAVAEAISRLRYGAIELTVHDGRVVQLEVTERQRFT